MYVSLIWFSLFLFIGHSGLTLSVRVGLGVVALRALGNIGVHWGYFPPIKSFIYNFQCRHITYQAFGWWRLIWCTMGFFGVGSVIIPGWVWAFRS